MRLPSVYMRWTACARLRICFTRRRNAIFGYRPAAMIARNRGIFLELMLDESAKQFDDSVKLSNNNTSPSSRILKQEYNINITWLH